MRSKCRSQMLDYVLSGFYECNAGKELIDACRGEECPHTLGNADDRNLAAVVGLMHVEVYDYAETGRVHVLKISEVHDKKVRVHGLQLRLKAEDMA